MHVLGLVLGLTLLLVAVVIVLIVKLSSARELVNVSEDIVALGWAQVAPDDAGWRAFTALASTGSTGTARAVEGVAAAVEGLAAVERVEEEQESTFGQGYRDTSAPHPRFLVIGTRTLRSTTARKSHHSETAELWIGEARAMPAAEAGAAYDVMAEMRPIMEGPLADRVRSVIKSRPEIVRELAPVVHVGPQAWVLVSPVARGGRHLGLLIETAKELSQAFSSGAIS